MKITCLVAGLLLQVHLFAQEPVQADSLKRIPLLQMIDNFKRIDSLKLPREQKTDSQYALVKSFVEKNPNNGYGPQFISWGKYFDVPRIDTLYGLLNPALTADLSRPLQHQKIRAGLIPPMIFPELILSDTLNKKLSIASLKGKVVLIDIWASWCGPCRAEMPELKTLYEKYKDQGFEVIAVSMDDSKEKWLKAIAKDGQPWPQYCDFTIWQLNPMLTEWGVSSLPYNFLIDREGRLFDKEIRISSLEEALLQLL